IVLNPRWKQTELLSALAGLECAIRHEQNRTSTPRNAEFLLGLVGQNTPAVGQLAAVKIFHFTEIRKRRIHCRNPAQGRGAYRDRHDTRAGRRWTWAASARQASQGGQP
ncbi:MAG TPA: hypothetical protein VGR99_18935, partial [Bradyrhizobium sp.]|nr:hypothetical protein [Bradyrhizobium sp.]